MPFMIRPYRCFPVQCIVTYHIGSCAGTGTVWNLSLSGWRLSGDVPLRIGEVCSLTVILPPYQPMYVAAGIIRWVRGEEYGVETLVIDDESREDVEEYFTSRLETVQKLCAQCGLPFVHLALPAFVGPGGGAKANER